MTSEFFDLLDLWRRQAALAGGYAAMAPMAGFVAATRITRMASEGGQPTLAGLREAERMISEKVSAAIEGGSAAAHALGGLSSASTPLAAARVMMSAGEAAMKPVSRTVRSNARRLSRSR